MAQAVKGIDYAYAPRAATDDAGSTRLATPASWRSSLREPEAPTSLDRAAARVSSAEHHRSSNRGSGEYPEEPARVALHPSAPLPPGLAKTSTDPVTPGRWSVVATPGIGTGVSPSAYSRRDPGGVSSAPSTQSVLPLNSAGNMGKAMFDYDALPPGFVPTRFYPGASYFQRSRAPSPDTGRSPNPATSETSAGGPSLSSRTVRG